MADHCYLVTNEISTTNYIGLDWNFKFPFLPLNCNKILFGTFWALKGNQYIFPTLKYQGFQNMSTARNIPLRFDIYIYRLKFANSRNESLMKPNIHRKRALRGLEKTDSRKWVYYFEPHNRAGDDGTEIFDLSF